MRRRGLWLHTCSGIKYVFLLVRNCMYLCCFNSESLYFVSWREHNSHYWKSHCLLCVFNYQNLKEQQTQRTPQYDSLMQALITKMDPQLQSKLGVLSEKWIRVKEETFMWHRMWVRRDIAMLILLLIWESNYRFLQASL